MADFKKMKRRNEGRLKDQSSKERKRVLYIIYKFFSFSQKSSSEGIFESKSQ